MIDYTKGKPIDWIKKSLKNEKSLQKGSLFLFGSRARGDAKDYSDYDIAYLGPELDIDEIAQIRIRLSDLPRKVDFVDLNRTSKKFQEIAMEKTIKLK